MINFETNCSWGRVGVVCPKFWPNDRDRKKIVSHDGSQTAPSDLTLNDLESLSQSHSDFKALYLVKRQSEVIFYY